MKTMLKPVSIAFCLLALTACPGKPSNNNQGNTNGIASVGPQERVYAFGSNNVYCDFASGQINCASTDQMTGNTCNASRTYNPQDLSSLCQQLNDLQTNSQNCNVSGATSRVISQYCGNNNGGIPGNPNPGIPGGPNYPGYPGNPQPPQWPTNPGNAGSVICNVRVNDSMPYTMFILMGNGYYSTQWVNLTENRSFLGIFSRRRSVGQVRVDYKPQRSQAELEKLVVSINYKDRNRRKTNVMQTGYARSAVSVNSTVDDMTIDVRCNENIRSGFALNEFTNLVCRGEAHPDARRPDRRIQFIRPLSQIISNEEMMVTENSETIRLRLNKETGELSYTSSVSQVYGPFVTSTVSTRAQSLHDVNEGIGKVRLYCGIE